MAFVTVYDLLEVNENASKEEIEKSYLKLVNEYKLDPTLSQEENNDNVNQSFNQNSIKVVNTLDIFLL